MSKNEARMRKALRALAAKSEHPRSHHAAIIMKDGKIISESENYGWMHAEEAAIEAVINTYWTYEGGRIVTGKDELNGSVLYTMMFRAKSGTIGDGTPCLECMRAIKAAGIRKVVVYL